MSSEKVEVGVSMDAIALALGHLMLENIALRGKAAAAEQPTDEKGPDES